MEERVTGLEDRPHAYIHRPNNQVAKTWQSRRQAWPIFMKTLGDPKSGLGKCTHQLVSAYVSVMNLVLTHSPKSGITDLRCEMDDAQHTVDRKQAWKFFVPAWNEVVSLVVEASMQASGGSRCARAVRRIGCTRQVVRWRQG